MGYSIIRDNEGGTAVVFVIDEREDGTAVLWRCHEVGPPPPGGIAVPSGPPDEPEWRYTFGRYDAIRLARSADAGRFREVVVDTTGMPRGLHRIDPDQFIERLTTEDIDRIELDPEIAEGWGWRGQVEE
jgi:hypothetical protein